MAVALPCTDQIMIDWLFVWCLPLHQASALKSRRRQNQAPVNASLTLWFLPAPAWTCPRGTLAALVPFNLQWLACPRSPSGPHMLLVKASSTTQTVCHCQSTKAATPLPVPPNAHSPHHPPPTPHLHPVPPFPLDPTRPLHQSTLTVLVHPCCPTPVPWVFDASTTSSASLKQETLTTPIAQMLSPCQTLGQLASAASMTASARPNVGTRPAHSVRHSTSHLATSPAVGYAAPPTPRHASAAGLAMSSILTAGSVSVHQATTAQPPAASALLGPSAMAASCLFPAASPAPLGVWPTSTRQSGWESGWVLRGTT